MVSTPESGVGFSRGNKFQVWQIFVEALEGFPRISELLHPIKN